MIHFGILGPLEALVDGEPVALGGPRQRAVLARLLLDVRRVVSSERIVDDVWNGDPPASAAKSLQKYVSELRKALPAATLRTAGGGYSLDADDESLDSRRFERLVNAGDHAAALALWRGEVLADLPDLGFIVPERARLDELRLFAIEARIDVDLESGRHGSSIAELTDLVDAHPLRERLTCQLMLALYRAGRQVEALRAFERHRRYLADEVGIPPAPAVRELEAAILRHDPGLELSPLTDVAESAPRSGNLHAPLTRFVGRSDELDGLGRAVAENRLVTLTGPGGVGKTRLAFELGARIADGFPGGVWTVDLAGVQESELGDALATTLEVDVRHAPDELSALRAALAHRPPSLLVLDNCEHLVRPVASIAAALLGPVGTVRVVATSRRPLGVDGEFVRPVPPLPEADAIRLFEDRARLTGAGADQLSGHHAREICTRLDGLPLAIELAASQLRVMHVDDIVGRLHDQLSFRGPAPHASPRQRTLGDMVRWSYDLLAPSVQLTFARLGVFVSSLSLPAAEWVCASGDRQILGDITTLIDHSLLVREQTPAGSSRYRLLETLRLFALDRLAEAGETGVARRSHAAFFLAMVEEAGASLYGPHEQAWRSRLELEEPNLQGALHWAADHDPVLALRLGVAMWPYWESRWRERHGVSYISSLLRRDIEVPEDLHAWALTAAAAMSANAGEPGETVAIANAAVAAQRRQGDPRGLAEALGALGLALASPAQLAEAERAFEEGLSIARQVGDPRLMVRLLDRAGFVAGLGGQHVRAAEINRGELAAAIALGSRRGEATALRHLAISLQHLGENTEAVALCQRALTIWNDLDDTTATAHVQTTLAAIARASGDLAGAERIYDAALVNLQAVGDKRCTASAYESMAAIAVQCSQHSRAIERYQEGLALRHQLGDEAGLAAILEGLASVNAANGCVEDAARLIGAAAALREMAGAAASPAEEDVTVRTLAAARPQLGDHRLEAAVASGRRMPLADVVELALSTSSDAGPAHG